MISYNKKKKENKMEPKLGIETKNYIIRKDLYMGTQGWWRVISKTSNRVIGFYRTKKMALSEIERWEREGRL